MRASIKTICSTEYEILADYKDQANIRHLPRPVERELVDAGPYSDPPPPRDPRDLVAVVEPDLVELAALSPVPAGLVPSVVYLNTEEAK